MAEINTISGFHLSPAQRPAWTQQPGGQVPYLAGTFTLAGPLDRERLRAALAHLLANHDILRTVYVPQPNLAFPLQVVRPPAPPVLHCRDLRQYSPAAAAREVARLEAEPFRQADGPGTLPVELHLLQVADQGHVLVVKVRTLAADGPSLVVLFDQLSEAYQAGEAARSPAVIPYAQYAEWQNNLLKDPEPEALAFWEKQILEAPSPPAWPMGAGALDASRPAGPLESRLDGDVLAGLRALAADNGAELASVFAAAWAVLLQQHGGGDALRLEEVNNDRPYEELQPCVGLFAKTLPWQAQAQPGDTFASLLRRVDGARAETKGWEDYFPAGQPAPAGTDRATSSARTVGLEYLAAGNPVRTAGNLTFSIARLHRPAGPCALKLCCIQYDTYAELALEARPDCLAPYPASLLLGQYLALLAQVSADPGRAVNQLNPLPELQRTLITQCFNDTAAPVPAETTIPALFEALVQRRPDDVALVYGDTSLTFRQLDRMANQLAHGLRAEWLVEPGDRVVLKMRRSPEMIVALLAILKTGACYVPVDAAIPPRRLKFILEDCQAALLLTDALVDELLLPAPQVLARTVIDDSKALPTTPPPAWHTPASSVYVIYTSGSTGQPKGVPVNHENLINYAFWFASAYGVGSGDRTLLFSSIAFDLSYTGLWPALLFGATLYVLEESAHLDPQQFIAALIRHRISFLKLTPSHFTLLAGAPDFARHVDQYALRLLVSGGEPLHFEEVARFMEYRPDVAFVNHYGPTETTIGTIAGRLHPATVQARAGQVIGRPIANNQVSILTRAGGMAPIGIAGEICVSGKGVATGYLNRDELTGERFVPHPLLPGTRMYRTGDLGRWLPDGTVEYLGREDFQVKVRGYRVELAEIENALLDHPAVQAAVVMPVKEEAGQKIVAYFTAAEAVQDAQLRQFLAERLPDYMIPARLLRVRQMPLTPNGKVNRQALQALPLADAVPQTPCRPPRNPVEVTLLRIFEGVLGETGLTVGDDFFQKGGHSLKAVRVVAQIYKVLKAKIELRHLFEMPTVAALAGLIAGTDKVQYEEIGAVPTQESYELSHAQLRLWVLCKFEEATLAYNMLGTFTLKGLDRQAFERAFGAVMARHEALRTTFVMQEGVPRQCIHPYTPESFVLHYADLRGGHDREAEARRCMEEEVSTPFDLAAGPLVRARLLHLENDAYVFLFNMHHIISDGWSKEVLTREVLTLYNAYVQGEEGVLPPLRIQYKDYSAWQNRLTASHAVNGARQYWMEQFGGEIPLLDLPADFQRPPVKTYRGAVTNLVLDREQTRALQALSQQHGTTLFMTLLAVVKGLLYRYTGQEDIVIGSPVAGRDHGDLENQIGFYVNTLALRTAFSGADPFEVLLEKVRNTTVNAFQHQIYPFDKLVDDLNLQRDMSRSPLFDVMVQLKNFDLDGQTPSPLSFSSLLSQSISSQFDLSFDFRETDGELQTTIEYNTDLFAPATIERLGRHLVNFTASVLQHPSAPLHRLDYLTAAEQEQLSGRHLPAPAPARGTLVDLFNERVRLHAGDNAVTAGTQCFTYGQLDAAASRLAHFLAGRQLPAGTVVGILLDKSVHSIASVLGVLKAGCAFLPLDASYPFERISFMLGDADCRLLVVEEKYLPLAHQLQWECPQLRDLLVLDRDDPNALGEPPAYLASEEEFWDYIGENTDNEIGGGGWISSYTGLELGAADMEEYADNTLQKLLPHLTPRTRVLEIGCSSGITMFRIAPLVAHYVGTDLSAKIIAKTDREVKRRGLGNVTLHCLAAHQIGDLAGQQFDIVIINSVIQSFEQHNYLREVLRIAVRQLAPTGLIYCGDLQDQDLKESLVTSLQEFQRQHEGRGCLTKTDWSSELFVSRAFLDDLRHDIPGITGVEHSTKLGTIRNELSLFRFDSILKVDKHQAAARPGRLPARHKYQFGSGALSALPGQFEGPAIAPGSAAYIIYTSGTTGSPKGVVVEHGSLVNITLAWREHFALDTFPVRLLQMANFAFDVFVGDLCRCLVNGGWMLLCPKDALLDPAALYAILRDNRITIFEGTPGLLLPLMQYMLDNNLDHSFLKMLIFGADVCPAGEFWKVYQHLGKDIRVFNTYGTTETTIDSSSFEATPAATDVSGTVPIGKPFGNNRLYILDSYLNLLPAGATGELCIGGPGVARGYLNRPELNAQKFLPDPFAGHGRLYRTGDVARLDAAGNVVFLGRKDRQVKVRGFRIELAEIENRLAQFAGLERVAVVARREEAGSAVLVAYFTALADVSPADLQGYLRKYLPEYMVPALFVRLAAFPLTSNGKIDLAALPREEAGGGAGFEAPRTSLEARLAGIWEEVLDRKDIGVRDNFFLIGGHSLKATRIIYRIYKELKVNVELRSIFVNPTIESLATAVEAAGYRAYVPIEPLPPAPYYDLSHAQQRLWVLHQHQAEQAAYVISDAHRLDGELDLPAFRGAFATLLERHEILRTTFVAVDDRPRQRVHEAAHFPAVFTYTDLREVPDAEARAYACAHADAATRFDLEKGPLWKVSLLQLADARYVFVLTMHHIISDGWSQNILVRDVLTAYAAGTGAPAVPLRPLPVQYRDFAAWQNARLGEEAARAHRTYWMGQLGGQLTPLELPLDFVRSEVRTTEGAREVFQLPGDAARHLRQLTEAHGATLFMSLVAGLNTFLLALTGQEDIVLGTPVAGRDHPDLEDQLGIYLNTLPLRTQLDPQESFAALLGRVKEQILGAYEHQVYPFDKMVEDARVRRAPGRAVLCDVGFTWQNLEGIGGPMPAGFSGTVQLSPFDNGFQQVKTDLWIHAWAYGDDLWCSLTYNKALFKPESAAGMADDLRFLLQSIGASPQATLEHLAGLVTARRRERTLESQRVDQERKLAKFFGQKKSPSAGNGAPLTIASALPTGQAYPLLIRPRVDGLEVNDWIVRHRDYLRSQLNQYGAVLLRGFDIHSPEAFREAAGSVSDQPMDYLDQSSPRSRVADKLYTSTDHPADQLIQMHNELSYSHAWPLQILFYCQQPPASQGQTPIADSRKVLGLLSERTRRRFAQKGIRYVRNLVKGLGLSWQEVYQTEDKNVVEAYCLENGVDFEWKNDDHLRIQWERPAVQIHPVTGEPVWFNHGFFFNAAHLGPDLLSLVTDQELLPFNTYYADGQAIEAEVIAEIAHAYEKAKAVFAWEKGDLLLLDNMLMAHGRNPFTGNRKILVSMNTPQRAHRETEPAIG
jgi:amino acid adenylation domain-containing protein